MISRATLNDRVGIVLLAGLFLVFLTGQDCAAQSDPCNPDPCQTISNAVPGTCMAIGGSCAPADDFTCECQGGFTWQDASNTCEEPQTGCLDEDQDGHSAIDAVHCPQGDDCDDTRAAVYPGAPELCDGVDNQCPGDAGYGQVDEGCGGDGMAVIPAGCFDMGDPFGEGFGDELPVHNVCISVFEMDVHEVTNAEYAACADAGDCTPPYYTDSWLRATYYGDPAYADFPVIWVDGYQAEAYCGWLGKRLPTEAEWEYAARGGLAGKRYPWGDSITGTNANYWESGDPWDEDTSEVEFYAPNGYGLYDMAGNVWEWVGDWYQFDYYAVSPPNDPPGPASGTYRVFRGGSFVDDPDFLRTAARGYDYPDEYGLFLGFRCAR